MNLHAKVRKFLGVLVIGVAVTSAYGQPHWVGSWAASQQLVEPQNSIAIEDRGDTTLRQIVHLTIGGPELRVHLSNRYGSAALHIDAVHIARPVSPDSSRIVAGSDRPLTFSGRSDLTIPAGADYLSDPIAYPVVALSDLAISIHLNVPAEQTGHPGSRATSYVGHGNQVAATEFAEAKKIEHWYFIARVDVSATADAAAVVVLGDSITDGHGATTNENDRWPDILARRLQASAQTKNVAVLNHGIGGNRLLLDGLGPNALARFDHDVLAQAGARYLAVLEGVNDIGMFGRTGEARSSEHKKMVDEIVAAYEQMIQRAHTHGFEVAGCTILPFVGSSFYHPGPVGEADRQAVNKWIRTAGHFDAVFDFDQVLRDPANPERLLAKFDSGDHLHPSPEGYAAMANAVPLAFFNSAAAERSQSVSALTAQGKDDSCCHPKHRSR